MIKTIQYLRMEWEKKIETLNKIQGNMKVKLKSFFFFFAELENSKGNL